ncbi:MAG: ABC transporter permease subunit [Desulfobulbaceae bacterium]|nr:ABC transporter permease subunit [Desulfobulbaceae bacterium]
MFSRVHRMQSLARLIVVDGLRRHALIGLILFALAGEIGGLLFFDFIPRDIGRATNDFLFSISWLAGFIFLLFHAVHVMAWDDDRRVLHTFLARPISRTEYVLAVFLGLAALLLALNAILGGIGFGLLTFVHNSVDSASYFQHLSFPFFLLASIGLYCIELMFLAVILLFSGAVRGNFPVLLLSLSYYFICSGLPVVRQAMHQAVSNTVGPWVEPMLKGLTVLFPDFSRFDFKMFVASSDPVPAMGQIVTPFALGLLYTLLVLWLACAIYQRRDLQ